MTIQNHENTAGGIWSHEIVTEAIMRPCPYCGVQPPENCRGDNLIEFTAPTGRIFKMHSPRLRQVPAFTTQPAEH
ncbi:hypothetical protein [[Mycobacterium] crassicus]|uniref:Uncharacterized protein n=1 Tax=[Mycobacterium] crassicus TaxID=2872309 RepID=A0ABU5XK80_9MYCO|nr:hypothetical protein [Mycolicibacter sp. MYC098]MEB3021521.1 hypothetical protein [Mycolicibacter sp. MYC098]